MTGMDLLTFLLGAMVVAALAGLTGRMPIRVMRGAHSGFAEDADERGLQAERPNAVAVAVAKDPSRAVMAAEIVDSLMRGTQFVALTGARGVGKTAVAATIRERLGERSVRVRWVDRGAGKGIRLRTIMSRFLDKPEADVDTADVERMFDAMTEREDPDKRLVLIIDDAEQLLPDAFGYLRLLASVAIERMPQVLFVGDPSFWDIADRAAQAGFTELIEARFELGALSQGSVPEAAQAANALVPMVLPTGHNRRIARMAVLAAAAVGSLGAAAYWLVPADLERYWTAGPSSLQSSDAAPNPLPAATTVVPPPVAATQAAVAPPDAPASSRAVWPQLAAPVTAPAVQWPAPKTAVHRRPMFGDYVTRSLRGTWLFPPGTGGGGG
jgi:hypothetical protein